MVYLDLRDKVREIGREKVLGKLEGILEIYEKFVGHDPLEEPMMIFPAVHYTMGGLWAGFKKDEKTGGLKFGDPANMMTNIPGLYAMGEASFAYHGANRLGANSLLSCIFDGLFGGTCIKNYIADVGPDAATVPQSAFDATLGQEKSKMQGLLDARGATNPYALWQEMGRAMQDNCTVVRYNDRLAATIEQCETWKARFKDVRLSDTGLWTNQNLSFTRALGDMIRLAEAILKAAHNRDESRGAHFKPDFPDRDDARFLKTTLAVYDAQRDEARIEYGPVDISLIPPRARTYGKKDVAAQKTATPKEPVAANAKPQLATAGAGGGPNS